MLLSRTFLTSVGVSPSPLNVAEDFPSWDSCVPRPVTSLLQRFRVVAPKLERGFPLPGNCLFTLPPVQLYSPACPTPAIRWPSVSLECTGARAARHLKKKSRELLWAVEGRRAKGPGVWVFWRAASLGKPSGRSPGPVPQLSQRSLWLPRVRRGGSAPPVTPCPPTAASSGT